MSTGTDSRCATGMPTGLIPRKRWQAAPTTRTVVAAQMAVNPWLANTRAQRGGLAGVGPGDAARTRAQTPAQAAAAQVAGGPAGLVRKAASAGAVQPQPGAPAAVTQDLLTIPAVQACIKATKAHHLAKFRLDDAILEYAAEVQIRTDALASLHAYKNSSLAPKLKADIKAVDAEIAQLFTKKLGCFLSTSGGSWVCVEAPMKQVFTNFWVNPCVFEDETTKPVLCKGVKPADKTSSEYYVKVNMSGLHTTIWKYIAKVKEAGESADEMVDFVVLQYTYAYRQWLALKYKRLKLERMLAKEPTWYDFYNVLQFRGYSEGDQWHRLKEWGFGCAIPAQKAGKTAKGQQAWALPVCQYSTSKEATPPAPDDTEKYNTVALAKANLAQRQKAWTASLGSMTKIFKLDGSTTLAAPVCKDLPTGIAEFAMVMGYQSAAAQYGLDKGIKAGDALSVLNHYMDEVHKLAKLLYGDGCVIKAKKYTAKEFAIAVADCAKNPEPGSLLFTLTDLKHKLKEAQTSALLACGVKPGELKDYPLPMDPDDFNAVPVIKSCDEQDRLGGQSTYVQKVLAKRRAVAKAYRKALIAVETTVDDRITRREKAVRQRQKDTGTYKSADAAKKSAQDAMKTWGTLVRVGTDSKGKPIMARIMPSAEDKSNANAAVSRADEVIAKSNEAGVEIAGYGIGLQIVGGLYNVDVDNTQADENTSAACAALQKRGEECPALDDTDTGRFPWLMALVVAAATQLA